MKTKKFEKLYQCERHELVNSLFYSELGDIHTLAFWLEQCVLDKDGDFAAEYGEWKKKDLMDLLYKEAGVKLKRYKQDRLVEE